MRGPRSVPGTPRPRSTRRSKSVGKDLADNGPQPGGPAGHGPVGARSAGAASAQVPMLQGRADADAGFHAAPRVEVPEEMRASFLERFEALGYIGAEDEDESSEPVERSSR